MSETIFTQDLHYLCRGIVSTYTKKLTVMVIQLLMGDWGYTNSEAYELLQHLKAKGLVTYCKGEYVLMPALTPYLQQARRECRI